MLTGRIESDIILVYLYEIRRKCETVLKFTNQFIKQNIERGEFGLEKESLRVDAQGKLAHTVHPFPDREEITRDFCENQTELITDVFPSAGEVLQHLTRLQTEVADRLLKQPAGAEYLWSFSNPPYVNGEKDIDIAQFEGENREKTVYRNYLSEKYGKRIMLFSGIHFNYSFPDDVIRKEYDILRHIKDVDLAEEGSDVVGLEAFDRAEQNLDDTAGMTYQEYKNDRYLQLAQQVTKYTWLLVYLMAASPVLDSSFLLCGKEDNNTQEKAVADHWTEKDLREYASPRCGEKGYWNSFTPILDYRDLEHYIRSIEMYIENGNLRASSELYYPVRVKPRGVNSLEHLREKGINHIELRMLDVNPLSPVGLFVEDLEFIHYFLYYLHYGEDIVLSGEGQKHAIRNEKQAARYEDEQVTVLGEDGIARPIREEANRVLRQMEDFYKELESEKALASIQYQKDKIAVPGNRYADRIRREYKENYLEKGLALARHYAGILTEAK